MLRVTRALFAAAPAAVKRSTGIVGLEVVPNARAVLVKLYEKTLSDVQIIPESAPYRQAVEAFTKHRMEVVKTTEDVFAIERTIGCGQVEELIEQAKNELQLIPQYASWKLWELKRPTPEDDSFSDIYDELEYLDPASFANNPGLRRLAEQRRAQAAAARKAAEASAAAAAAAAAKKA